MWDVTARVRRITSASVLRERSADTQRAAGKLGAPAVSSADCTLRCGGRRARLPERQLEGLASPRHGCGCLLLSAPLGSAPPRGAAVASAARCAGAGAAAAVSPAIWLPRQPPGSPWSRGGRGRRRRRRRRAGEAEAPRTARPGARPHAHRDSWRRGQIAALREATNTAAQSGAAQRRKGAPWRRQRAARNNRPRRGAAATKGVARRGGCAAGRVSLLRSVPAPYNTQ
ncbi:uncharacterized protein LOC126195558 [Schistocerca nitens]|uniref:uncharacterized protein LOC126195558 n=1 Tax=Schistocerca nitens TaxID=7011 RepID=UPI00211904A5|nr:uncharacterized protein LOC126195558 [Schistocerca nitens]